MNVLLVDDDPEIRLLASFVLGNAGHTVTEAADGTTAAALLAQTQFDVVLMDVMLEHEDGVELASRLLGRVTHPRLVFLTGASRPDQVERMRAAGAAGILQKPFDPTTLSQRLNQLVSGAT